jgi:hypothetical protein
MRPILCSGRLGNKASPPARVPLAFPEALTLHREPLKTDIGGIIAALAARVVELGRGAV